jgi:hypothetical protein
MNPWALLLLLVAVVLVIVAWRGSQDNVVAAIIGRQYGNSTVR